MLQQLRRAPPLVRLRSSLPFTPTSTASACAKKSWNDSLHFSGFATVGDGLVVISSSAFSGFL